ncbi:MAG: aminotransferase class III-fold pyridoxal phosphate-dependent enzyme [Flavobacteriaceae bacterium]|nr:aminotransferase class III-fold pyridoxal phosphate-dependent enzyme [Flavobacteriaceae bacterium]
MPLFDVYPLYEVEPTRARGVYVYDQKGTKYLDLYGGHAVISIGHGHRTYKRMLKKQLHRIGFYSNAVQNPLQEKLSAEINRQSGCTDYELFMCSSGAEANENALKLASFHTGKSRVIAFDNAFHGRTSAAVAATDNKNIQAPLNAQQKVDFIPFNDADALEKELAKGDVCAVIFEAIQGVGGLDEPTAAFVAQMETLCENHQACLIADEVQSGFGRSGDFFAFQKYNIKPHIISIAKGMGNGFPVGGILVNPVIKAKYGMLGTTFGGNHLACSASLAVLQVLEKEKLYDHAKAMGEYFIERAKELPFVKTIKGRGLMLGLEFEKEVGALRKELIFKHRIFTGGSSNKNLIRILPPLNVKQKHLDQLFTALNACH